MAVDDLWYVSGKKDDDGKPIPTKRHGRGKRYRVRYTDPTGQPKTKGFDRKGTADAFDLSTRSDVARGVYVDPKEGRTTFREIAEQWRPNQAHGEKTATDVESYFRLHVYPYLGARQIGTIRTSDIQGLIRQMPLAPSTIKVVLRYVSSVFNAAIDDGRIPRNPCLSKSLKRPTIESRRVKPLPVSVVDGLRAEAQEWSRVLEDLGALAGLRQGEAFGLEVEHVDFLRRELHVEQQLQTLAGQAPFLKAPKTPKSRRTVPIGTILVNRLAEHLARFPARSISIVDKTGLRPVVRQARLLVLSPGGVPVRKSRYSERVWVPAVRRMLVRTWAQENGVPCPDSGPIPEPVLESYRRATLGLEVAEPEFHELRHFYASALIRSGLSVKAVADRLGHKNAMVTLGVYGHLWPDDDDRTRDAMDAIMAPVQDRLRVVE